MRQPIFLLMTLAGVVLTALLPVVGVFALGEEIRLVRDGGLALFFGFGLLTGCAAASATLYGEKTAGTAATVLCKPVSRGVFFLAKAAGVLGVMALFSFQMGVTILLSVRLAAVSLWTDWHIGGLLAAAIILALLLAAGVNYFRRRSFVSQASIWLGVGLGAALIWGAALNPRGQMATWGAWIDGRVIPATLLISMSVAILALMALSLSTRLAPRFTLALCAAAGILGLLADWLEQQAAPHSRLIVGVIRLLPNWQDFWMADALAGAGLIPWSYVGWAGAYALLMMAGVLAFGGLLFRNADIG